MSHLDDMLENIVTPVFVSEFVGYSAQLLPCHLFDLCNNQEYVELVEIEELDEDRDYGIFYMLFEVLVFL